MGKRAYNLPLAYLQGEWGVPVNAHARDTLA